MQIVEILDSNVKPHCLVCGKRAFDDEGDVKPCKHMMFVSSSETPDEPWYVHESITMDEDAEEDFETVIDALKQKLPGPDYVMFLLSDPAPSGLEVYVLYRVTGAK